MKNLFLLSLTVFAAMTPFQMTGQNAFGPDFTPKKIEQAQVIRCEITSPVMEPENDYSSIYNEWNRIGDASVICKEEADKTIVPSSKSKQDNSEKYILFSSEPATNTYIEGNLKYEYIYESPVQTVVKIYQRITNKWELIYHTILRRDGVRKVILEYGDLLQHIEYCYLDGVITRWTITEHPLYRYYYSGDQITRIKASLTDPCADKMKEVAELRYTYNGDGLVSSVRTWDIVSQRYTEEKNYTYNGCMYPSRIVYRSYNPNTGNLQDDTRYSFLYNSNCQETSRMLEWYYSSTIDGTRWVPKRKIEIVYNSEGQILFETEYYWIANYNIWFGTWVKARTYAGVNAIRSAKSGEDEGLPKLLSTITTVRDTLFNSEQEAENKAWSNLSKQEMNYDVYGNMTQKSSAKWNAGNWAADTLVVNEYDYTVDAGQLIYPVDMDYTHKIVKTTVYDGENKVKDEKIYEYRQPWLSIEKPRVVLNIKGDELPEGDSIKSAEKWTVSHKTDWLKLQIIPENEMDTISFSFAENESIGNAVIKMWAEENTSGEVRHDTITITPVFGGEKKIYVTQVLSNETSIISAAVDDKVTAIQYYDLLGMEAKQPRKGSVYIVRIQYQSGKVSARKEMYK
jgi:hypothetical protein